MTEFLSAEQKATARADAMLDSSHRGPTILALLDEIVAKDAEIEALRADFERYGNHAPGMNCCENSVGETMCNCGLDSARRRWAGSKTT